MPQEPLVSVIMPAYNAEKTIAAAIQSILDQDYKNFELIIVDDASTDETAKVVKSFADPRLVFFQNTTNLTAGPSRNVGIAHAQGEFIALQDADDLSLPHRLRCQVNFMLSHPEIDVVGSDAYAIDSQGHVFGVFGSGEADHEKLITRTSRGVGLLLPTCLMRATWIKRYGFRNYPRAHDVDLFLRSYRQSRFHNLGEVLYVWREPGKPASWLRMLEKLVLNSSSQIVMRLRHRREYGLGVKELLIYPYYVTRKAGYWIFCSLIRQDPFKRQCKPISYNDRYLSDSKYIMRLLSVPDHK